MPSDRDRSGDHDRPAGRGEQDRGFRATTLVVVLAALIPLSFAGWLGWQAVAKGKEATGATAGRTAAVSAPAAAPSSASASMSASASAPASASASAAQAAAALPLAGKVVTIDPGHNPTNYLHPQQINALVQVGNGSKACDTTGTATDSGYPEADFSLDVARRVRAILQAEGAEVVLTQDGNLPWGPCVTTRAAIGNQAHSDAAISIHGDGAGPTDIGFHVILPASVVGGGADTAPITGPSRTLGLDVRSAFHSATGEPFANYVNGGTGLDVRSDLGGLNLSTVPKVFIECGNMRNATDAQRMTDAAWRQLAAKGIAAGLTAFLIQQS
ncbi:N-acetylmuramoyl-L-alanine amidase [Streptacidiphilus albus]|uniref:N-acetylmuramoyl-L-alanine amidase n=1 Tax=Streptacidiphilus albus TaxID=105425 RepID=UPI0009DF8086|nr:N-acetylmuramoyl-L-alanine amidase [Streptacidiphilus albus]